MKPAMPSPVMAALFEAQKAGQSIPASTTKTTRDGAKTIESTYAGSEDALAVERKLLVQHQLMASPVGWAINERRVMTLTIEVVHVPTGSRLRRKYDVEVGDYGSNAAASSGFATALRLLLMLPREPEQVRVRAPEGLEMPPDLHEPRATERVVLPPPVLPVVQGEVDRAELERGCTNLLLELQRMRGQPPDHRALKAAAGVPVEGRPTVLELRRYAQHLAELVRHEPEPPQAEPDPPPVEPPLDEEVIDGAR